MKMIFSAIVLILFVLLGCGSISHKDVDPKNQKLLVKYSDHTAMGKTRDQESSNGNYYIYDSDTMEKVGYIRLDGEVYDYEGKDLGYCTGAINRDGKLNSECILSIENPDKQKTDQNTVVGESCQRKTCSNMDSCDEAYYKLDTCGHTNLDRDHDGVPCESICSGG